MIKLRSVCNRWGKRKLIIHSLVFVQCIKDEQEGNLTEMLSCFNPTGILCHTIT